MPSPKNPRRRSRSRLSLLLSGDAAPNHNSIHNSPRSRQQFHFSPRATTLQRVPRLWDRRPYAPANPFSRNRRVWKRVLSRKSKEHGADNGDGKTEAEDTNGTAERGVKRMKVSKTSKEDGDDAEENEKAFVETKWADMTESEQKRKYPNVLSNDTKDDPHWDDDKIAEINENSQDVTQVDSAVSKQESIDDSDKNKLQFITIPPPDEVPCQYADETGDKAPRKQYAGLEGDVAEVLTDFLSRAKAKRAEASHATEGTDQSDKEDSLKNASELLAAPHLVADTGRPTRRALADLDKNSPSPVRSQFPVQITQENGEMPAQADADKGLQQQQVEDKKDPDSAAKVEAEAETSIPNGHAAADTTYGSAPQPSDGTATDATTSDGKHNDKETSASVATTHQSGRKTARAPKTSTINLKRATGAEFVFKQRSDEQQLALTTKANTKKNRGNAKLPHLALPALRKEADQQAADGETEKEDKDTESRTEKKQEPDERKRVAFDDENLVSFCDGDDSNKGFVSLEDVGLATTGKRKATKTTPAARTTTRSSGSKREDSELSADFSPSVPRKVRRIDPTKRSILKSSLKSTQSHSQDQAQSDDTDSAATPSPDEHEAEHEQSGNGDDDEERPAKRARTSALPRADTPKPKRTRNAIPRPVTRPGSKKATESATTNGTETESEETGRGARRVTAGWSRAAAKRRGSTKN